jgi:hypothetical protein
MAAKKATTKPTTPATKYVWFALGYHHVDSLSDDSGWRLGLFASLESVVSSDEFGEFMDDTDHPDTVYLFAVTSEGKPHRFHRIEVQRAGYKFKEV